jgi:hypothetical protein
LWRDFTDKNLVNMIFLQSKFNYHLASNFALASTTCLLSLTSLANPIIKPDKSQAETVNISEQQICPSVNLRPKRTFDTAKYRVHICRGNKENPLGYYVRFSRDDDNKMTIPVSRVNGETYIAIKGVLVYTVTPYDMVVRKLIDKQSRVIQRERVNRAIDGDGQALTRGCPDGNNTFVEAETRSFLIYICGAQYPLSYIAIARDSNEKMTIPLQNYNPSRGTKANSYLATKGNIQCILTQNVLKISQDGRTIIKEKVLRWN